MDTEKSVYFALIDFVNALDPIEILLPQINSPIRVPLYITFNNDMTIGNTKIDYIIKPTTSTKAVIIDGLYDDYKTIVDKEYQTNEPNVLVEFRRKQAAGGSDKIKILGRLRKIYKEGRKSYIVYNKEKITITVARKLEKAAKQKQFHAAHHTIEPACSIMNVCL